MEIFESFKKTFLFIFIVIFPLTIITLGFSNFFEKEGNLGELKEKYSRKKISSVDHSKFEILQKDFKDPHEVTAACLSCHTERGKELMSTAHWNWEREEYIEGRGITYLGKKNLINNFCTGIMSNEPSCNKCHAGLGWTDKNFDFNNQLNIDCLVCHDKTGTYEKATGMGGHPPVGEEAPDYKNIVANVGRPMKHNCGYCHFNGGGGNNVKHGDLETALLNCDRNVDIHMAKDGLDMNCVDCHPAENHQVRGKYYAVSSSNKNRTYCTDCHNPAPHKQQILNEHTIKVDCRTCHIPHYAKVNPTKLYWDWSTAGAIKDGEGYSVKDSLGREVYTSKKGTFIWGTNVQPEYVWFNGTADHFLITDKIEKDTININTLFGSYDDPNSKIIPIKIHRGKQPYDLKYKTLLQAKLWATEKGEGAFWIDLNWDIALKIGMEYVGLPFSGQYGFINTKAYLPVSHMVSKSEDAVSCRECHNRNNSRLKNVPGVYIPATSYKKNINMAGTALMLLSLLGVLGHAALRIRASYKRKKLSI
ncbi:MAG: tetrathionate reductase family octaheme c-type cytochrome [Bacteroidales bacterium]|jgi:octaheme c-type cytochrome (tetrathionate reductase family)|nr:tetrathionate reductase family octaheme c-type cytochrome [Bacteroidales bacterium]HOL98019.1 tetrathionate reductase family octaheme c-type cytochrome [Bacteroidales bacterium]HOM36552.1 tetrathionate reductase family octaheme c-type cytochrome [Bacteroidales bacterium]HPD23707.1 tetrathionate reductase family octaheme c-type cytochrome [Bacteroidales bacterium]HRS99822.1 tetrathionate reductase family octaheme c-type cytochrome [Bacteroidales bacterium]